MGEALGVEAAGDEVLPPLEPIPGLEMPDDLLTAEERADIGRAADELDRVRRRSLEDAARRPLP